MKTLVLVRHAKSSWQDLTLADFDRPLNERGKRDAPRMAKHLKSSGLVPQCILSSPATRAVKTARIFARHLLADASSVKLENKIYEASADQLLNIAQEMDDAVDTCMLVGHNPGLTDFANRLMNTRQLIENVPTTGVVLLGFDIQSWKALAEKSGSLIDFITPAGLQEKAD